MATESTEEHGNSKKLKAGRVAWQNSGMEKPGLDENKHPKESKAEESMQQNVYINIFPCSSVDSVAIPCVSPSPHLSPLTSHRRCCSGSSLLMLGGIRLCMFSR